MSEINPVESVRYAWRVFGLTVVAFALSCLIDKWAYDTLHYAAVYDKDWGRLLRIMGFLGTWAALALAIGLQEGAEPARRALARRRAWLIIASPALGGLVAEVFKLILRRQRPAVHEGLYGFRPFDERTWSTSGLALPSSHALVAFAGAAMLARLYPRARWVGYTLAIGCGVSRIFARAHFVSDVVLAAGLGWLVAWALARKWDPQQ